METYEETPYDFTDHYGSIGRFLMKEYKVEEHKNNQLQEIMDKTQELLDLIINSEEYKRYQKGLKELQESGDIYERVNEFRLKNLSSQMLGDDDPNTYSDNMQQLYTEYKDILMEPMVSQFMFAEQSICKIMRKVQDMIADGVEIDISYM